MHLYAGELELSVHVGTDSTAPFPPPPPPQSPGSCLCGARTFHTGGAIPNWGARTCNQNELILACGGHNLGGRRYLEGICCDPAPPSPPSPPSWAADACALVPDNDPPVMIDQERENEARIPAG